MRSCAGIGCLIVVALSGGRALAQEGTAPVVSAVLARADARVYTPALAGLKDLRVVFHCAGADERIVLYWKAPGRRVVRFETPDGKPAEGPDFELSDAKTALELAVPVPFAQRKASSDAGGVLLQPTAGDVVPEARVWAFDPDGTPLRLRTAGKGDFRTESEFGWRDVEGKLLLEELRSKFHTDMGSSAQTIHLTYEQIGGYWLPVKATIARGEAAPAPLYSWSEYRVNAGVPDDVFRHAYGP